MSSRSPAMAFYDTQSLLWGLPRKCSNASQQWQRNRIGIGGLRQCSRLVTAAQQPRGGCGRGVQDEGSSENLQA